MKTIKPLFLIIIAIYGNGYGQVKSNSLYKLANQASVNRAKNVIGCEELMNLVERNADPYSSIPSYVLYDSSWLKSVEAYEYEGKIFVIAEIKRDFSTDKYVFCGIPKSNWNAFKSGTYDYGKTYGERFHKYIIDYTCNCN